MIPPDGRYGQQIDNLHVIDCQFDYRDHGGCYIPGALDFKNQSEVAGFSLGMGVNESEASTSGGPGKKTLLVSTANSAPQWAPTL